MCNVPKLLKFILFAEDTHIFHSHSHLPDSVSELNTELCVNKPSLNIAQTNYILFGRYNQKQNVAIIINNMIIQRDKATKFLGVLFEQSLNWKNYINMVTFKLSKVAPVIYSVSHCVDHSSMRTLYCSLFVHHLVYCSGIRGKHM